MPYKRAGVNDVPGINRELEQIERTLNSDLFLPERNRAPDKPRVGQTVLADGTNWNPGSGAGVYTYYGGSWHKLG